MANRTRLRSFHTTNYDVCIHIRAIVKERSLCVEYKAFSFYYLFYIYFFKTAHLSNKMSLQGCPISIFFLDVIKISFPSCEFLSNKNTISYTLTRYTNHYVENLFHISTMCVIDIIITWKIVVVTFR